MTKYDYDKLQTMAKELGRPLSTLYVLAQHNDPFLAGTPTREANAKWAAAIWRKVGFTTGVHGRRIHYRMISEEQDKPFKLPNGADYINTHECWATLGHAIRDARYLAWISADDMVDRRNAEPLGSQGGCARERFISLASTPRRCRRG